MTWYNDKNVSFKRVFQRIEPVCKNEIRRGTIVFYEVPVKSVNHFTVDIIRYTMQLVYTGEVLFPCSFNTDMKEDTLKNTRLKVFFDRVFRNNFKRHVTDKLAMSLMDTCTKPFIFKALGSFSKTKDFNCLRVSFVNGETYLVATKDIDEGSILTSSCESIVVPGINDDLKKQFEAMNTVLMENMGLYIQSLSTRNDALSVRPDCEVLDVKPGMDTGLEERILEYGIEREMGFLEIREAATKTAATKETDEELLEKMETMYNGLMEEFDNP